MPSNARAAPLYKVRRLAVLTAVMCPRPKVVTRSISMESVPLSQTKHMKIYELKVYAWVEATFNAYVYEIFC